MKRLLVLRHAKSSWKDRDLRDHDRPLNKRGKRDAPRMGRLLRNEGLSPEWAFSSTATRARVTLDLALEQSGATCEAARVAELYLAAPADIVDVLRTTPDPVSRALVVGHNPGMEDLVQGLTGEEVVFPTAALAVIDCEIENWADLALTGVETLVRLWKPRELADDPDPG
jgi:phosphohistidine phosphatase